jgi:outer membrane protein
MTTLRMLALLGALGAALGPIRASGAPADDEPLTLAGAMQRARENAREVGAARARLEAAEARARQAKGFRLPSVNLTALWTRTDNPAEVFALKLNQGTFSFPDFVQSDPNSPAPINAGITRGEIAVPLFTGGELSGRIGQAKLGAEAASNDVDWAGNSAALAAAEAYVKVAQAEEYAALLAKARETVVAHVALARNYVEQGMLVRSELLRAEVELAHVDDLVEEAVGNVRVANANLAFRLGAPGDASWQLSPLPEPRPAEGPVGDWLSSAAERPDLAAAQKLLAAGELEEKVRKAPLFPKLAFVARGELYGEHAFGSSGTSGSIMAVITWNVFSGGADLAAAAAARAEARAGREDVARFAEGVRLEVRQAFEEAATARARAETARKALAAARESERITAERFRSGVVKMLDLLDATTARREAETRELVARAEANAALLRLAVTAGRRPESVLP